MSEGTMNQIALVINTFAARLKHVQEVLQNAGKEVLNQEYEILNLLHTAGEELGTIAKADRDSQSNEMQKITSDFLGSWANSLQEWKGKIAQSSKIRADIEKFGSGLIVAVFGRTNAGKSTLGNFIRGKSLKDAKFDNAWKHADFQPSRVFIIEKGADAEVETGEEWFREGAIETTREAQLFTLPGLLWLDTPGFGSPTVGLGDLARKYVKRADIVIYLDNSENPGLRTHSKEAVELLANGRLTLLVINHSDKLEKVRGIDGKFLYDSDKNPVREPVAKSSSDRIDQEAQIKKTLEALGFSGKCDATSISMLLANKAVETHDDNIFEQSNLANLFDKIMAVISSDESIVGLKYVEGRLALINLIDNIVGDAKSSKNDRCIETFIRSIDSTINYFKQIDNKFNIQQEVISIATPITMKARSLLINKISELETNIYNDQCEEDESQRIMRHSKHESRNPINANINFKSSFTDIVRFVKDESEKQITNKSIAILQDLWKRSIGLDKVTFPDIKIPDLQHRKEEIRFDIPTLIDVERDPEGLLEHIGAIFGATYYRKERSVEQSTMQVDLGLDTDSFFNEIYKPFTDTIRTYISKSLQLIRQECILNAVYKLVAMKNSLINLEDELKNKRSELESQINQ